MGAFRDLTGKRYGKLTVKRLDQPVFTAGGTKHNTWLCECDCGNTKICRGNNLASGRNVSCGCAPRHKPKHGYDGHPLQIAWEGMISRCYNKNCKGYKNYGARGITVCPEWRCSPIPFIEYMLDLGWREGQGLSIDRIDNSNSYRPGNIRLATRSEQARNQRRNVLLEFKGRTATMIEWSEVTGIPYRRLQSRIYRGWSAERALAEAADV